MHLAARRLIVSTLSLTAVALLATGAHADPIKCQRSILKESGKFAQAKIKALAKCEEAVLKGKFPPATNCHIEAKAAGCDHQGGDQAPRRGPEGLRWCRQDLLDDRRQRLARVDLVAGHVSRLRGQGLHQRDQRRLQYDLDVPRVHQRASDRSGDQPVLRLAESLVGGIGSEQVSDRDRQEHFRVLLVEDEGAREVLGRAAATASRSSRAYGPTTGDGKYIAAIDKAELKKQTGICKACGGDDQACDGSATLSPALIGFSGNCPAVAACGGPVTTLAQLVACVDCVTEFKVDCEVPLAVPGFQPYPGSVSGRRCDGRPRRRPPPGPATPTPTRTATPTPTATVT